MKTSCLTTLITLFLLPGINGLQAQTTQQDNKIVIGTIDSVYSNILNEQRKIWIYVPGSAINQIYTKQHYPVIYLLDGDGYFPPLVGMLKELNGSYVCPEMIVVGIPNTDRTRDLSPSHVDTYEVMGLMTDHDFNKTSGGGENFVSFIEKELIPHIDSLYPTDPYRLLIGHSMGGLTVINVLIHHTSLFRAYVAIDPAMSWDNEKLLKEAKTALAEKKYPGASLFLSIANTVGPGMDTIRAKQDTGNHTEYIRSNFELRDCLARNRQNQLRFAWRYYGNDDHGSVVVPTMYDALRNFFDYYHFDIFYDDHQTIATVYDNMSKYFGYSVKPPESMVNYLGYTYLTLKQFDRAFGLLNLNITNYPDSWAAYNYMGNYYRDRADTSRAIDYYRKALSVKEVPVVRQKLEKFQGK